MMIADSIHKDQFQSRLKRIAAGGPNTTTQYYAGPGDIPEDGSATTTIDAVKSSVARVASFPVAMFSGILIGTVALVAVRYARFRLYGGGLTGPDADLLMAADIITAITMAIMVRMVFRVESWAHGAGKLVGVLAAVGLMHNVVHFAPALFERGFSTAWVNQVIETTQPNSILLAGQSIAIADISTTTRDASVMLVLKK